MRKIDPDTGEILFDDSAEAQDPAPSADEASQAITADSDPPPGYLDEWGEESWALIQAIEEGPHYRKKRTTILRLAEAAYLNVPQKAVFSRPDCAARTSHYKWRKTDPAYEEAYLFLVGDATEPGLAKQLREAELDEDEVNAISSLQEARTRLRLASRDAVEVLVDALDAFVGGKPQWRERIMAANSILDRADTETAVRRGPSIAIVDQAIMQVYGDSRKPGLPAGDYDEADFPADEEHDGSDGDVIDMDWEPADPATEDDPADQLTQELLSFYANAAPDEADPPAPADQEGEANPPLREPD